MDFPQENLVRNTRYLHLHLFASLDTGSFSEQTVEVNFLLFLLFKPQFVSNFDRIVAIFNTSVHSIDNMYSYVYVVEER